MSKLYFLLGANLGDKKYAFTQAVNRLEAQLGPVLAQSPIYETEAWGEGAEGLFWNQVIEFESDFQAVEILRLTQTIERELGRERGKTRYGPRTIDIDILIYGEIIVETDILTVPHPRLHERRFALTPLAAIAPALVHPVFGKSISQLLDECPDNLKVWPTDKPVERPRIIRASFSEYRLRFKQPSGTSRGVYTSRCSWFVFLDDGENIGIGECAPLPALSVDNLSEMGAKLLQVCASINQSGQIPELSDEWPSIRFGIEMALLDLKNGGKRELFSSAFVRGEQGIAINGLIWMGELDFMERQVRAKIEAGFRCIKIKIGALDFDTELGLLKSIRQNYSPDELTLRVDANGAYSYNVALENVKRLSDLHIHSIEQPIAARHRDEMASLCRLSPVPIALDEELIGINSEDEMARLLADINPAYLILKPSLHGGFAGCEKWMRQARNYSTDWWITSALESNIGLNAIAQWTYAMNAQNAQGLGTGQLFTNNFDSPLEIEGERLWHRPDKSWTLDNLLATDRNR